MKVKDLNLDYLGHRVSIARRGSLDLKLRLKYWWNEVRDEGELDNLYSKDGKYFMTLSGNTWIVHPKDEVEVFEKITERR